MRFVVLVGLLVWGTAWAQPFPPRVLVIFDTSGSMGVDVVSGNPTGGDGSVLYPGQGVSRLAVAKDAIRTLVETTSEAEFALMRYPQLQGAGINRGILDGRQNNTYEGLEQSPLNYAGECDGAPFAAGPEVAFSLLTPFGAGGAALTRWLDHHEAFPGDPELRAEGPTPIVETLSHAAEYLRQVAALDPGVRCRRYTVILLTDGGESCVPQAEREAQLRAQAAGLRALEVEVAGNPVALEVRTYVVAFSVNQFAAERLSGVTQEGGTGRAPYLAADLNGLRLAFARVLADAIPVEICDGLDDDCDGIIDEGALNACGACGPTPAELCDGDDQDCDGRIDEGVLNACGGCGVTPAEICNGADDDCDGVVDEAVANACGGCAAVQPERCNNLDDDCDGRIDNVPGEASPLVRPCGRAVGACSEGVEACHEGVWGGCSGVSASVEKCDDLDNDCDGLVDEDSQPCGPLEVGSVGECRLGARACAPEVCAEDPALCANDGWLVACVGAVEPADEICDGRDNDCDGAADEGLINACGGCGPPAVEACNGEDDNCDGRIDEGARCPTGYVCFAAACVQPCRSGECSGDLSCRTAWPGGLFCHPDPCAGVRCPAGELCEEGTCIDPCEGVNCPDAELCALGVCGPVPCAPGCGAGQVCVADACVDDDCEGTCADDTACKDGRCIGICADRMCGAGRSCVDGACLDDPCGGRCLQGQRCEADGLCAADPCFGRVCPAHTRCEDGVCSDAAACLTMRCPEGTVCEAGHCTDFTPGVDPLAPERADGAVPAPDGGVVDAGITDASVPNSDSADADLTARRDSGPEPGGSGGDCSVFQRAPLPWGLVLMWGAFRGLLRRRSIRL